MSLIKPITFVSPSTNALPQQGQMARELSEMMRTFFYAQIDTPLCNSFMRNCTVNFQRVILTPKVEIKF